MKYFFTLMLCSVCIYAFSQNTFPSNGNVGIGTTSPSSRLEIRGDGVNAFPLIIKNNTSSIIAAYAANANGTYHAGFFNYKSRGSYTSPTDVFSNDRVGGFYALPYISGGYRANAAIEMYVGSGPSSASYPSYILFGTTPTGGTTRFERMRITESGTVGIGTTSPNTSFKLDVNGIINATGLYVNGSPYTGGGGSSQWTTSGSNIYYNSGNIGIGTTSPYSSSRVHAKSSGANPWGILTEASANDKVIALGHDGASGVIATSYLNTGGWSPLELRTQNLPRMTISVAGDVGIGTSLTSNPNNYKLAVNGTIGSKEVKVETSSTTWPDYVFKKDYQLNSIDQVDEFIKENGHLPGVPTAKDIEQNGQALGEMNTVLLKKIEELTLYVIKQNELINNQNDRISKLEKNERFKK